MAFHAFVDDIRQIKEDNPFESMMSRFDRAAQIANLDPDLYTVMRVPNREIKVYIPVRMDDGHIRSSPATECSTTSRAARPRAAFATRPT